MLSGTVTSSTKTAFRRHAETSTVGTCVGAAVLVDRGVGVSVSTGVLLGVTAGVSVGVSVGLGVHVGRNPASRIMRSETKYNMGKQKQAATAIPRISRNFRHFFGLRLS